MAVSVRKKKSVVLSCKPGGSMCFKERDFSTMATEGVSWPVPMRAIGAQNLLTMPGGVSTSGYLHKKGGSQISLLRWPLRYLIIHKGCVYYFKSSTSAQPQGAFSLNGYHRVMRASEETTSSNVFPFKIIHLSKKQRTWYFSAASEDERRKWMKALRKEMNYYNDRKDSMNPSDSDSDADSFYGTIERSVDIKSTPLDPEADYMMEDDDDEDDDDEADYVKPDDSPPPCIGKSPVPPPSYPPPPVPFQPKKDSAAGYFKTLPLPLPPPHHRNSSGPAHRNLPPAFPPPKPAASLKDPPAKGPAPPLPFAPHLAKPGTDLRRTLRTSPPPAGPLPTSPSIPPPVPPPPPCASLKKAVAGGGAAAGFATFPVTGGGGRGRSPASAPAPAATLPFCADPKRRMVPDGYRGNGPPAGPPPIPRLASPLLGAPTPPPKHASLRPPPIPKPASPSTGHRGPSLQRLSPVGQSFRTSGDADADTGHFLSCRKPKRIRDPSRGTEDDSDDDDYENVQLPASVFVDTTETLNIERLFKKISTSPKDGLYCIRNSGTGKTSQVLVVWDVSLGKARNYRLFQQDSCVFLEADLSFPTLAALVEHYHVHPLPNNGSLCLQQPYARVTPR